MNKEEIWGRHSVSVFIILIMTLLWSIHSMFTSLLQMLWKCVQQKSLSLSFFIYKMVITFASDVNFLKIHTIYIYIHIQQFFFFFLSLHSASLLSPFWPSLLQSGRNQSPDSGACFIIRPTCCKSFSRMVSPFCLAHDHAPTLAPRCELPLSRALVPEPLLLCGQHLPVWRQINRHGKKDPGSNGSQRSWLNKGVQASSRQSFPESVGC